MGFLFLMHAPESRTIFVVMQAEKPKEAGEDEAANGEIIMLSDEPQEAVLLSYQDSGSNSRIISTNRSLSSITNLVHPCVISS
jgi:hypothetical protein